MIPLAKPYFDDEELAEIKKVLDSGWVSQGPKVKEFEEGVCKYLGVKYAVAVSNCTAALHLSLLALGIKAGDEVLVADFTFPATGHAVLYCGAKPVFVDVDAKTYNIDPAGIEKHITDKTKAIIPVHTFGQPADMDPILEIARKHNLYVVEDAACAFGAKYKGKFAGTLGDIGCFSFHARKGITTGEGGMIVTNNETFANEARTLSVFGMVSAWDREKADEFSIPKFVKLGYNYKLSDISAAIGVVQLKKLNNIIAKRRVLAKYWNEKLRGVKYIELPYEDKNAIHIYQSYVALVDKRVNRNKLIDALKKVGIQAQIGTYASHIQPIYVCNQKCSTSLEIFNRSLALPLYQLLTEKEIDAMVPQIAKALKTLSE